MTHESITAAILTALGWTRVGLTLRDERTRERAADTIASSILDALGESPPPDRDQLALPL